MRSGSFAWLCGLLALAAAGCDVYARPNLPLPDSFRGQLLEGGSVDGQTVRGHPWVISLWVPG